MFVGSVFDLKCGDHVVIDVYCFLSYYIKIQ